MTQRPNPLGDLRAEVDRRMLEAAFIETPDFKTLIGSCERSVVVGRRGTGKSALTHQLAKYWTAQERTTVVLITPEEDQVIGLRGHVGVFGEKFSHLRAGCRIAWRYAFLLEIAAALAVRHKFAQAIGGTPLNEHLQKWRALSGTTSARLRQVLRSLPRYDSPEDAIGNLSSRLPVGQLQECIAKGLSESRQHVVLLIDKLDEGYETDNVGVGIVDGLIQAAIDINTRISEAQVVTFVRDNIFRAVSHLDSDFSRNIEGQVLRLHWTEHQLMNLVTSRLRVAFDLQDESDLKIWNQCAAADLKGRDGFRRCLQLTLYRPRDIIALLNQAFYGALKQGRGEIVGSDVEATARDISQTRLDDLHKEYSVILPGLSSFTKAFAHQSPERAIADVHAVLDDVVSRDDYSPDVQQNFALLGQAEEVTRALYSVGFLGVREHTTGHYVFCHDGNAPAREFVSGDRMLVHPCYWMALNLARAGMEANEAEQINDEYDIDVTSVAPKVREARIGSLIARYGQIPTGEEGAAAFEEWCLEVVRVLWGAHLRNVLLHPNNRASQRRDIVGANLSERGAFRRILEDYGSRQVIFEVKNYKGVGPSEFRQMISYLTKEYGQLGFVVTRDDDIEIRTGSELEWVRELHSRTPPLLVIRLTGRWLTRLLSKLRSPLKHDEPDNQLQKLIDTYERLYTAGQGAKTAKRLRRSQPGGR